MYNSYWHYYGLSRCIKWENISPSADFYNSIRETNSVQTPWRHSLHVQIHWIKWKQSFMEWMLQIEMLEHSVNGDNTREDENTKYFCQVSGKTKLHHSLKIPRELVLLWTRVAPAYANMIQKSLCSCTLHSRSFSGSKHAVPLPLSAKQPVNGGILSLIWLKHPVKRQTPITAVSLL